MSYADTGAPLAIEYDEARDIVTICGMRYTGSMFRALAFASPGTWLRINERGDGWLTVFNVADETERMFDAITGQGIGAKA